MYQHYKVARDMSWQTLINCNITSLPVNLNVIARHYKIKIIRYSKFEFLDLFKPEVVTGDGFIARLDNKKVIFLNDKIKTRGRRRFTLGHELGHGILGHNLDSIATRNNEIDNPDDPLEMQANVFARDILAPSYVLNALGVSTVEEIMQICDISKVSAQIRLDRLNFLRQRNAFLKSSLENIVYLQFKPFIDNFKK